MAGFQIPQEPHLRLNALAPRHLPAPSLSTSRGAGLHLPLLVNVMKSECSFHESHLFPRDERVLGIDRRLQARGLLVYKRGQVGALTSFLWSRSPSSIHLFARTLAV